MTTVNPKGRIEVRSDASPSLRIGIPVKAIVQTEDRLDVIEGRLEAIGEGQARIFFAHSLPEGTVLTVLVEFKDRRDREIRFRYEGKIASASRNSWHEVDVDFDEGVSISGKDARELLAELFPKED